MRRVRVFTMRWAYDSTWGTISLLWLLRWSSDCIIRPTTKSNQRSSDRTIRPTTIWLHSETNNHLIAQLNRPPSDRTMRLTTIWIAHWDRRPSESHNHWMTWSQHSHSHRLPAASLCVDRATQLPALHYCVYSKPTVASPPLLCVQWATQLPALPEWDPQLPALHCHFSWPRVWYIIDEKYANLHLFTCIYDCLKVQP